MIRGLVLASMMLIFPVQAFAVTAGGISVDHSIGAVIVGHSSSTCNSTIKGAIRYTSSTSLMAYCNGSNWLALSPSGSNTQIQYNSGGTFGASATFNYAAGELNIDGSLINKAAYLILKGAESPVSTGNDAGVLMRAGNGHVWNIVMNNAPGVNGDLQYQHYDGLTWTNPVVFSDAGKVGVQTSTPRTALDVSGSVRVGDGGETCSPTVSGALRYTSAGTMQYCNGSNWTSTATGFGKIVVTTESGTGSITLTAAEMVGGVIIATGGTAGNWMTATAANIIAAIPNADTSADGSSFYLSIINKSGVTKTMTANTGVTLIGTAATMATAFTTEYLVQVTGPTSVKMVKMGTMAAP